jgi:hypothetical protein
MYTGRGVSGSGIIVGKFKRVYPLIFYNTVDPPHFLQHRVFLTKNFGETLDYHFILICVH